MKLWLALAPFALAILTAPATAAGLTGHYVEARTADVWTGPCFANADFNISGRNAVMAWKIAEGTFEDVNIGGFGVVAVVTANNTLGLEQTGPEQDNEPRRQESSRHEEASIEERARPPRRHGLLKRHGSGTSP